MCECEIPVGVNRKFGNGSNHEIFTLHTPHQIPQISLKREGEAAREEVGEEEEGVPEDESLPRRGERHASTRIGVGVK